MHTLVCSHMLNSAYFFWTEQEMQNTSKALEIYTELLSESKYFLLFQITNPCLTSTSFKAYANFHLFIIAIFGVFSISKNKNWMFSLKHLRKKYNKI